MSIMATLTRAAVAAPRTAFVNAGRSRRRAARAWDGIERRRFRPDGDLLWDWIALRQHYLRPKLHLLDLADLPPRATDEAEPHWLEDPLTFQPLSLAGTGKGRGRRRGPGR